VAFYFNFDKTSDSKVEYIEERVLILENEKF